ncbi:RNA polymerase sigma factor [Salegentibacter sp. T436]|jgi:RNA polymerase sigma-70 factor (ECF subfamily)|uniref:RNA polymerase sigma factor n=1 Tax=Salegentibacter sp. T436 TaxID=1729720 RepID=UPI00094A91BD|nr:RNA polymerase sigma factor [Salegentibacter sp. T436]APS39803.1 RNA polymerase subunit sigma [Salegentibacter sp. T436]
MNKEEQYQKIYKDNYTKVMRLCLGYVHGNEDLAKDLTQEVFLKAWQHLNNFQGSSKIETWIYRITVNTCLQELRKKKPLVLQPELVSEETSGTKESEIRFIAMYHCINQLSPENKSIILLELEGVPQQEIAGIIGIGHQAVRTRIHRIKQQLSKCVKDE